MKSPEAKVHLDHIFCYLLLCTTAPLHVTYLLCIILSFCLTEVVSESELCRYRLTTRPYRARQVYEIVATNGWFTTQFLEIGCQVNEGKAKTIYLHINNSARFWFIHMYRNHHRHWLDASSPSTGAMVEQSWLEYKVQALFFVSLLCCIPVHGICTTLTRYLQRDEEKYWISAMTFVSCT